MGSRYCENCNIHFPAGHSECDVCGAGNSYVASRAEDPDWELSVETLLEIKPSRGEETRRSWRRSVLSQLGFHGAMLDLFTESQMDLRQIEKMRKQGCSPDMVAQILL